MAPNGGGCHSHICFTNVHRKIGEEDLKVHVTFPSFFQRKRTLHGCLVCLQSFLIGKDLEIESYFETISKNLF